MARLRLLFLQRHQEEPLRTLGLPWTHLWAGAATQWESTCPACTRPWVLSPTPEKEELHEALGNPRTLRIKECCAFQRFGKAYQLQPPLSWGSPDLEVTEMF